ncbi:hypothetical protein LCGC14_0680740 [marine sediment metagenome]|uniref:starch synthase n=1 Tax=marine sediment metagenome TaxID=412755 RepID=A0A0F9T9K7_9ZZZZ|nr:glycogen synthase GlgA [Methylophaga aminisulfidivorans]
MRKILFASSEVHPLMKTGGLADVSASLPYALSQHGQDVRVFMPAYRQCLKKLENIERVAALKLDGYHESVDILEATLPGTDVVVWLLGSSHHFDRDGGPYSQPDGEDWEDNAARFALFCRAIVALSVNEAGLDWQPDVLHCNDWQTGLAPALLSDRAERPDTIFTIHNMAYQGLFGRDVFDSLDLPESLWSIDGLEFYGLMSFMKAGLIFSDHITTVSPSYAREICDIEYGYGLEGLLRQRAESGHLTGILNGIDYDEWNPATDTHIETHYSAKTPNRKKKNKRLLQQQSYLPISEDTLLIGLISRLVSQKGVDLSIAAVAQLLEEGQNIQLICLGSGEEQYEHSLRVLRARFPDKVALTIGYNETLSHQIEAGVDVFLMPSRFEPCGLNQMYSLRYGTLPIVRNTGGLADTVVDASEENRKAEIANGFCFTEASPEALILSLRRAIALFQHPRKWRKMMITAMTHDFSWENSATLYIDLYHHIKER